MAPQKRKPQNNHKKKYKFQRRCNPLEVLQHLIRNFSCWNCGQLGHNRFQCPFPSQISCSFCRTPGVLTTKCNCFFAKNSKFTPRNKSRNGNRNQTANCNIQNINKNLIENNNQFMPDENIVIEFQNVESEDTNSDEENVQDCLELDTDEKFLDEV